MYLLLVRCQLLVDSEFHHQLFIHSVFVLVGIDLLILVLKIRSFVLSEVLHHAIQLAEFAKFLKALGHHALPMTCSQLEATHEILTVVKRVLWLWIYIKRLFLWGLRIWNGKLLVYFLVLHVHGTINA